MLEVGQPFKVEVTYQLKENLVNSYIGVAFIDLKTNIVLTDILDVDTNEQIYEQRPAGIYTSIFNFSNPIFNQGTIKLFVHGGVFPVSRQSVERIDGAVALSFFDRSSFSKRKLNKERKCSILLDVPCEIKKIN